MAKLLRHVALFVGWLAALASALFLTLCASIFIFMHDPVVLDFLETSINTGASNAFECDFNTQLNHVDIIAGVIFLTDVIVTPQKKRTWFWTCDSISITVDWAELFAHKQVVLTISCGVMQIVTEFVDGKIAIAQHLQAFTREKEMAIPIIPEKLSIKRADIVVYNDAQSIFTCNVTGAVEIIDNEQHIGLTVTQDQFAYNGQPLVRDLNLSVKRVTDLATKKAFTQAHGTVALRNLVDTSWCPGKLHGSVQEDSLACYFTGDDKNTQLSLSKDNSVNAYHAILKTGLGTLTVNTDLKAQATVALQRDNAQEDKPLLFTISYLLEPDRLDLTLRDDAAHQLHAQINYTGSYVISGATDFLYALIKKNSIPSEYQQLLQPYTDFLNHAAPFTVRGIRAHDWQHTLELSGLQIRIPYTYNFLRSLRTTGVYRSHINHLMLRDTLLQTDRGTLISGMSTFGFDAQKSLQYAHLPIVIQDFFINRAKDFFAELSAACVLDYHKQARSNIKGMCAIKKCHIRNNPFSGQVGNDIVAATINPLEGHLLAQATDLDLIVQSYEPVEIKTPFLQARAHVALQVLGTVSEPQLYGQIEIMQGTLNFPYKPLEIQYGKIFFVDNERDDPAIELSASAVIKNYTINLYVDGTAQNPIITFQSTPSLQEEQILGLLFGGSPDSSLSLVMPLSSMGMVEKLLVGSSDEFEQAGLKNWLGPLENVKIVPRFSDQTSRGGLRAALAIEVNENLSALIQQNFSLSEDTLIEVAYKPLDELTIRGIRDERGDFGGEVEARFTW